MARSIPRPGTIPTLANVYFLRDYGRMTNKRVSPERGSDTAEVPNAPNTGLPAIMAIPLLDGAPLRICALMLTRWSKRPFRSSAYLASSQQGDLWHMTRYDTFDEWLIAKSLTAPKTVFVGVLPANWTLRPKTCHALQASRSLDEIIRTIPRQRVRYGLWLVSVD